MKKIIRGFVLVLGVLFYSNIYANEKLAEINTTVGVYGMNVEQKDKNNFEIDINESAMLAAIPDMQKQGLLNPDVTQTMINMHPVTIVGINGVIMSPMIVRDIYEKMDVDAIKVKEYISSTDDYGNAQKHLFLSFTFTKALNNKINWDNIDQTKFMNITPNKSFSAWYQSNVEKEVQ